MNTEEIMELSLKISGLEEVSKDSAIYVSGDKIKKALFCIDAGISELLLAKKLRCDAVIAHHPVGETATLHFHEVFKRHVQQMLDAGVSKDKAENAVKKRLEELEVEAHTRNYTQVIDVAKLLKMPFMNIHTPLDEIGRQIMSQQIRKETDKNSTLKDIVAALQELSEFRNALTKIEIRLGKPANKAGNVVVSHGAGTNGGYEIAKTYFEHGINTVIYIHVGISDLAKLKEESKGNLIITGHVASDSIGINPLIKELEKRGITVIKIGIIQ